MDTYARKQGFTLVIDNSTSEQQAPLVLYASSSTDIAKAVIDAYNVKSGVPAPPAQPAAAAHAPAAH
jgi:outer membrane protein